MLSLLEYSKLVPDILTRGFIEVLSRKSPILERLPFVTINASALSYNREALLPDIGFRAVNEDWTESSGTLDKVTESLAILGGVVDTDVFFSKTGGDINDVRGVQTSLKSKALAMRFNKEFIKGDVEADPKGFDGLQARIGTTGEQIVEAGSSSGGDALSLAKLDELLDKIADGDPDILLMNKTLKRRLSAAARDSSVGGYITYDLDAFGRRVQFFNDIPIGVVRSDHEGIDILPFNETGSGGGPSVSTSIYACKFGPEYLFGIQAAPLEVLDLGRSGGNKFRTSVEWYASIAVGNPKSIARLRGIKDAAVVA